MRFCTTGDFAASLLLAVLLVVTNKPKRNCGQYKEFGDEENRVAVPFHIVCLYTAL